MGKKVTIKLGDMVVDKLTGFTGKVLGIGHYMYEASWITVQPVTNTTRDNELKTVGFRIGRLKLVEAPKKKVVKKKVVAKK